MKSIKEKAEELYPTRERAVILNLANEKFTEGANYVISCIEKEMLSCKAFSQSQLRLIMQFCEKLETTNKQQSMKAKIRKTGEIVDVIYHMGSPKSRSDVFDFVFYVDSKGVEHTEENHLNYYWDFESIENEKDYNWDALRNQAAIAAMQGVMNFFGSIDYNKETIAKLAVEQADALIEELKKK